MSASDMQPQSKRKSHSVPGIIAFILAALVLVASAVFFPLAESSGEAMLFVAAAFSCLLPSFWIAALVLALKGLKDREHHRLFPTLAAILVLVGVIPGGSILITAARYAFGLAFGQ